MSNTPPNPAASANALNLSKPSLTQSSASTGLRHLAGKKNANKLKDEEIKAIFIARQPVLASIMEDVRNTQLGDAPQHHLIIGLRGMGKSTLLRRIEAELRTEEYVHRFIPLAFPEEHYARVRLDCLSEFWLNCLDSLANTRQQEGLEDEAKRLDVIIREFMRSKLPETELATECKKVLDAELLNTGRRPVLLLDNFVKLMGRLPNHDWALRSWLQASDAPLLIAANVEQPSDLSDYSAAFYDSMKTHWIGRLDVEEVLQVMRTLVEQENRPRDMLNQLNQSRPRLAALHALTGGNPRTVIYLYQLLVGGLSEHIEQDLKRLMDDIDALYEVRLNNLADQAYEVFAALALAWRPQSAAQLKLATGLQQGGVSGQLARLEDTGLVEKMPLYNSKKTGYQVTERLFNIWYLERIGSRRDAAPVESLAAFLEAFYTPDTMRKASQRLMGKSRWNSSELVHVLANAKVLAKYDKNDITLSPTLERAQLELARQMADHADSFSATIDAIIQHVGQPPPKALLAFAQLEKALEKCVPTDCDVTPQKFAEAVLGSVSLFTNNKSGETRNKIAAAGKLSTKKIKKLMSTFQNDEDNFETWYGVDAHRWLRNLLLEGKLTEINNREEWADVIARANTEEKFERCNTLIPTELVELKINVLNKIIQTNEKNAFAWNRLGIILSENPKTFNEAKNAHEKAISLEPEDVSFKVALGWLFENQKQYEQAESLYRKMIADDNTDTLALNSLADLLSDHLERIDEAEKVIRKTIKIDTEDGFAWGKLGNLLKEKKHKYVEAEYAYLKGFEVSEGSKYYLKLHGNSFGNLLYDYLGKTFEAKNIYEKIIKNDTSDICAAYNLIFLLRDTIGECNEAKKLFANYSKTETCVDTLSLHHALFCAYEENWGEVRKHFFSAFECSNFTLSPTTRDDWFRACAVMMHIGGAPAIDKLLGWIAELDATAKLLPLVEALQAIAIGSRDVLMNSPAEVRPVASSIYDEIELRRVRLPATSAWKAK
jgi:tetratricopeptide (TPR) repeat protein